MNAIPTVAQLRVEARRLNIPGRSAMRKAELIAAIQAATQPAPDPAQAEPNVKHGLRKGGQSWCGGYHVHATIKPEQVTCPDCLTEMGSVPANKASAPVDTRPFPADGSPLAWDAGNYRLTLTPTIDGGYVLRLTGGIDDHVESFTDERLARTVCAQIKFSLDHRTMSIWQLLELRKDTHAADVETFTQAAGRVVAEAELIAAHAAQTVTARDPETVAEQIRADWDTRHAETVRVHDELVNATQADRNPDGWRQMRQQATQQFRTVRPTKTQVFRRDLTAAQRRILDTHPHGIIPCGPGTGITAASLRALRDKVGGEFIPNGISQYGIAGLRLPAA
ncbi:MAG TPA: Rho termination factor N-terminal domain-containing protein [Candidatus Dormibacteraeota bacterium]|jgi:hypothetical protein